MRNILMCSCTDKIADLAPFVLRVVVGIIFALHGYQKLTGGVESVTAFLTTLGFPAAGAFAILLIAAELGGGILLILGLFTHWIAKILAFVALVAMLTVHLKNGFFMSTGGYEYTLLLFAASISLVVTGAGKWSLDHALFKKS